MASSCDAAVATSRPSSGVGDLDGELLPAQGQTAQHDTDRDGQVDDVDTGRVAPGGQSA